MGKFILEVLDAGGTATLPTGNLNFTPVRFSAAIQGGNKDCQIQVDGPQEWLLQLLNMLNCTLIIRNRNRTPLWWGHLNEVQLYLGKITIGLKLDDVRNRISVKWSQGNSSGQTSWIQDDISVATYGQRDHIESNGQLDSAAAAQLAATLLALKAYPQGTPNVLQQAMSSEPYAMIWGRGKWQSLGYKYYAQTLGLVQVQGNAGVTQAFGNGTVSQIDQLLTVTTGGWLIGELIVPLAKVGNPGDSATVSLCADSGGAPGTVLDSQTVAASALTTTKQNVSLRLSDSATVGSATNYHIVLARTGAGSGTDYYATGVDEGLTAQPIKLYTGSWAARSPAAMMPYQLLGYRSTTNQLIDVVTNCGQYVTSTDIVTASGRNTRMYRAGEQDGISEATALLQLGTSGGRRLLALVTVDGRLRVEQEPLPDLDSNLQLTMDGRLRLPGGLPLEDGILPVGQWITFASIPQPVANAAKVSPFMLDWCECDGDGNLYWDARGVRSLYQVGGIVQG